MGRHYMWFAGFFLKSGEFSVEKKAARGRMIKKIIFFLNSIQLGEMIPKKLPLDHLSVET